MSRVRGWCPSAHRPMLSGDGLLVRVRPRMARLSVDECRLLADLAERFGNGLVDLTTRGNLQIRGVRENDHAALLGSLIDNGFVEGEAGDELPLTVTPFPDAEGLTERLVAELKAASASLPELPGKIGIVVDTGEVPCLQQVSGDFRFEQSSGGLVLRADGVDTGRIVTIEDAATALVELANWFVRSGGGEAGRMRRLVSATAPPDKFLGAALDGSARTFAGPDLAAGTLALAFGRVTVGGLRALCEIPGVLHVVFTPWRAVMLTGCRGEALDLSKSHWETGSPLDSALSDLEFISVASDPLTAMDACPGAPECEQATVDTRGLARILAKRDPGVVHISGCDKGCARRTDCPVTLIGRDGRYDLVVNGGPRDIPALTGLSVAEVIAYFEARSASDHLSASSSRNIGEASEGANAT